MDDRHPYPVTGCWFEDLTLGRRFEHATRRTVTEADNVFFTTMTMNPQPLHLDEDFARTTEFGQRLVNSLLTLSLVTGLTVLETTLGTTIANLGFASITFPTPVFHGDTLRATTEVVDRRPSRSRPGAGIVVFEHVGLKGDGEQVVVARRSALMKGRPG